MKRLLKTVMPIVLCTAFLAGCQSTTEVKGTDPVVNTDDVPEVLGTAEDVFGKAAAIRVADVTDGMYEEPLQIDLTAEEVEAFSKQYGEIKVNEYNNSHNRYLIIDSDEVYDLGTSLNRIGGKDFTMNKIEINEVSDVLIDLFTL